MLNRSIALVAALSVAACAQTGEVRRTKQLDYRSGLDGEGCCLVVAHAGGAIDGNVLTNSLEAIEANYRLGTRFFEIDFSPTVDGKLAATHDWKNWRQAIGDASEEAPGSEEFLRTPVRSRNSAHGVEGSYTPLLFAGIEQLLDTHQGMLIVTDTKYDLWEVVRNVESSRHRSRFLIQAYSLDEVDALVERGFAGRIILTIYKLPVAYREAEFLPQFVPELRRVAGHLYAITVPLSFASRGVNVSTLTGAGVPVLVHGQPAEINSRQVHERLRVKGVAGLYLD